MIKNDIDNKYFRILIKSIFVFIICNCHITITKFYFMQFKFDFLIKGILINYAMYHKIDKG